MERPTDAELLRTSNADPDAFCALYDRYVGELYGWAHARIGDAAADLVAEVFARAWLSRRRFRDEAHGSAAPWLYGIAQNVLHDALRRRRVETAARERLGLTTDLAAEDGFDAVDTRLSLPRAALTALAGLSVRDREILELRVVEERPYREIAARLHITPVAARLRVSRALRRLVTATQGD
jgi:RNA polymerase sigma-70 factor (ECF subfamily)